MDDLITFFILCCIGWALAQFLIGVINGYYREAEFEDGLKQHISKILHRVEATTEKDICYWFDHDSGQFLAQGKNVDEVIENLKSRFPDHLFCLHLNNQDHLLAEVTNWKIEKIDQDVILEAAKTVVR
jgi:hypothetical protein